MRFGVADPRQPLIDDIRGHVTQVGNTDGKVARSRRRRDALGAVGQELHQQHRVPQRQPGGRRAEPVRIDPGTIELDVEVPSYPAELLVVVAADPHRVLHRRQRERLAFLG